MTVTVFLRQSFHKSQAGDVITAIIIGAFMIHGLQPGPMMCIANANIIYALFLGLIVSSVLLLVVGSVEIPLFRYIAEVPRAVLLPTVFTLCVFGVYAVNDNVFHIGVAMGWLGYFMMRNNIPAAPFLIAFILGPLLEDNFQQAMLMSGGSGAILFRSPITWFFWALTLITVLALVRGNVKANARAKYLRGS